MFKRLLLMSACFAATPCLADPLLIGAWVGGYSGETYPQPTKANVDSFQRMQDRKLDIVSYFAMFNESWSKTKTYADIADQNGSILLVTWMANGYNLDDIINGDADAAITSFARGVKTWGKEIWLRPFHEANGDWYDWGIGKAGAGNTSAKCIEAWKHVVQIFRDLSVTNVKWMWTTNATNSGPGTSLMGHYPGDDWVDYNSIDGYNWGDSQSWSSWLSFQEVFTPAYTALAKRPKPIFIAEFSSTENGGDKAAWIRDMFAVLPEEFPRVVGIMWFSQSKSAEADWAVNTSPAALEAWKQGIKAHPPTSGIEGARRTGSTTEFGMVGNRLGFRLEQAGEVRLERFAPTGRRIESVSLGRMSAGSNEIRIAPSTSPSVVVLETENGTRAAKIPPVP